jgi:hypothetical protein
MEKLRQWQRVKKIVAAALERGPQERSPFLDGMCSQDTELRTDVESLLLLRNSESQIIGPYRRAAIESHSLRHY